MLRTFIALWALIIVCALGTGSASAHPTDAWFDSSFPGARAAVRAERAARPRAASRTHTRARSYHVASARSDEDRPAPRQRQRARTAHRSPPSLTGGSGYQSGIASFYHEPQRLASGGWFNPNAMTAAHRSLPFGTRVRVTNLNNGRAATVTINDRGPYAGGRVIDLSRAAAGAVGMIGSGLARVKLDILGR